MLHNFLQNKRYLIVLDDIWNSEDWAILSPAFPNEKLGSKVLLTTRNKAVASHADPWSLHLEPKVLSDEQSWKLLCKKAFPNVLHNSSSSALEKLGREMLKKCGGLPLGVAVLGGLLANKLQISEWEVVHRNVGALMNKGPTGGVLGILSLSYNDLPYHLKPCFLYLGLYPEDFEIPTRELMQLWTAEGFIQQQNREVLVLEAVGEEQYLAELVQRCMVQVARRSLTGKIKTFRMHDLMREMCLLKAREHNFLEICPLRSENELTNSSTAALSTTYHKLRRHAIHKVQERYATLDNSNSHLRTLVFFVNAYDLPQGELHLLSFKLLKVLDLKSLDFFDIGEVSKQIAKLVHLRYLRLGFTEVGSVSSSIDSLRYLQTLDIERCTGKFRRIPERISNMEQLRHLYVDKYSQVTEHLQMDNLINLQTLKSVRPGRWMKKGSLEKLTSLRKLGLYFPSTSQVEQFLNFIDVKSSDRNSLRSVSLHLSRGFERGPTQSFPNLELLSRCHALINLKLYDIFYNNDLLQYPPNLVKLTLIDSKFSEDPMQALQHLPNLTILNMESTYEGEEMSCSAEGFPELQFLNLRRLENLREWEIDQGGMPLLKHLRIDMCLRLTMLPEGLRFVTSIQELQSLNMPTEFNDRIARGGEDWNKVECISSIIFK